MPEATPGWARLIDIMPSEWRSHAGHRGRAADSSGNYSRWPLLRNLVRDGGRGDKGKCRAAIPIGQRCSPVVIARTLGDSSRLSDKSIAIVGSARVVPDSLTTGSTSRIASSEGTSAGSENSVERVRLHSSGTLPTAGARRNLRSARLDVQLKRKSHRSSPRTSVLVRTSFS